MGYWSEYQITWMEREEMFFRSAVWEDHSILSPGFQLLARLEDLKHRLKLLLLWDNLYAFKQGRSIRDWRKVYTEWPEYWTGTLPDKLYSPTEELYTVETVLTVMAGIHERLFFYGIKPDENNAGPSPSAIYDPLDGQLRLPNIA